jgi:MraZ protein
MFHGRSRHTLDSKGRLAIPARFKEVLEQNGGDSVVVTNHDQCLWAFEKDDWKIIEEQAARLSLFDPKVHVYIRYFISGAVECQLKQGRITIPADLREHARLDGEVVLVGCLKRFEIWQKELWDDHEFPRAREEFAGASEALLNIRF